VELFGADQAEVPLLAADLHEKVRFSDSGFFPVMEMAAASAGSLHFALKPTSAKVAASYNGGDVAATIHPVGRGHALLLGVTPGDMFRASGAAKGPGLEWLCGPVRKQLGPNRAQFDCPESEVTVFDHPSGIAVLIALFTKHPEELSRSPSRLSVKMDRTVQEVRSALRGPLPWRMREGRVEIEMTAPAELVVDAVLIR
jgi:hypothetical protein